MEIIDISPPISSQLKVWPGDVPFTLKESLGMARGDCVNLGSINTTLHLGAHVDAPSHYSSDGWSIDMLPLHHFYGPCQVVEVSLDPAERLRPHHLEEAGIEVAAPRVLLKTDSSPSPHEFSFEFNSLHPELVDHLVERGVVLVGIDTPSIDPYRSVELESHHRLAHHDGKLIALEGLMLREVEPGFYKLAAFPLNIVGGDASPVRALLLKE